MATGDGGIDQYIPDGVRGFFYTNSPGGPPLTQDALQSRRKIAEAIIARRRGAPPKNIGEGLTALGEGIGDRASLNEIDRQEREFAAQMAGTQPIAAPPAGPSAATATTAPPPPASSGASVSALSPSVQTADAGAPDEGPAPPPDTRSAFNQPNENAGRFEPGRLTNLDTGNSVIPGQIPSTSFGPGRAFGPPPNVPIAGLQQNPDPNVRNMLAQASLRQMRGMAAPGVPSQPNFTEAGDLAPPTGPDTSPDSPVRMASLGGDVPIPATQAPAGNPPITMPDMALAPTRLAQAGGMATAATRPAQAGQGPDATVPQPWGSVPPSPIPQPGGRTPVPQVELFGKPPPPRIADPGKEEQAAIQMMQRYPGNTIIASKYEPVRQAWEAYRKANYARDLLDYEKIQVPEYAKTQEAGRKAPETEVSRRQEELKLQQGMLNLPTQTSPVPPDISVLGTPASPQRTGSPTMPPPPPGITPDKWRELQAPLMVKAQEAVKTAVPQFEDAIAALRLAREHPGRKYGVGAFSDVARRTPGTEAYDFGKVMEQIGGKNFLAAYQQLKGAGAVTEVEGTKAEAAQARLATAQTPAGFDKALNDFETSLRTDLERIQRNTNAPVTAWYRPGDPNKYAPDIGQPGERNGRRVRYMGGNPRLDASYEPLP